MKTVTIFTALAFAFGAMASPTADPLNNAMAELSKRDCFCRDTIYCCVGAYTVCNGRGSC